MSEQIISNRYQIIQNLGEGGFGQTFLAVDLHLPTRPQCVVKKLQPQATDEENIRLAARLFEQEAEVQYRLGSHPNIPTLLAHFEDNGEFYLVQELIVGETLAQEFARGQKYSEADTVYLLDQILETLSFVHQQNVIHRDIKPTNLIRRRSDGKVFLIDFGAVKQVTVNPFRNAASFHSTVAIGSAGYIPSEQAAGKPCFASDLYGVGLLMIQALTGIHPLQMPQNRNTGEFVWQHKVSMRAEVVNFISKLVRYDYRQRWYSAKEAAAALQLIRTGLGYQRKVEAPRLVQSATPPPIQPIIQPQFIQPVFQPQVVRPVTSEDSTIAGFVESKVTAPKFEPQPLPPTVVQFEPNEMPKSLNQAEEELGFWGSNFKVGMLTVASIICFFAFLALVAGGTVNVINAETENPTFENQNPQDLISQNVAYNEAIKLADEASELSKKASTVSEWQEIANKYSKAGELLKSINPNEPIIATANQKILEFQTLEKLALSKVTDIQKTVFAANISKPVTNSTVYPTSTSYSNNYPAYAAATPTPVQKKAKMPGKRKEKMYLSFSSSTGDYIGQGKEKSFTYEDGNFSASVNYNNGVTIRFDGGPDTWSLDLAAPQKEKLTPGSYGGAQRFPFNSPTRPGLSFTGSGRGCNESTGSFTINNIFYSLDGKYIYLLDATFVQYCEGTNPPIMGRIYYDAR